MLAAALLPMLMASFGSGARAASDLAKDVALGKRLFHDPAFSSSGRTSCATCHSPDKAFSDGLPTSRNAEGLTGTRNAPSLANVRHQQSLFWDGRRASLHDAVVDPLVNPREHALASHDRFLEIVRANRSYREAFRLVFGGDATPTMELASTAIVSFLSTVGNSRSRFDRFMESGGRSGFNAEERAGFELFSGSAKCATCHPSAGIDASFTDDKFHAVGFSDGLSRTLAVSVKASREVPPGKMDAAIAGDSGIAMLGRYNISRKPADIGRYRTPSLRNVALTAPYFHDGSARTLEDVVEREIYYRSASSGRALVLTPEEKRHLVAFLRTLTADEFIHLTPTP